MPLLRLLLCATLVAAAPHLHAAPRPILAAYVFAPTPLAPGQVDASHLTRIYYAFATLQDGRIASTPADDQNLAQLTALRKQNPALIVLISIGGWLGSAGFSDAALTPASRAVFIDSAIAFVRAHDLDGIDLDWEYPGLPGAGNPHRPEDKHNFTLLLAELRRRLTREGGAAHRRYALTLAAGAFSDYLAHTEMAQVAASVDAVNLMAYDFYMPGVDALTGNHAPLYADPADPKKASADAAVRAFESAGVPAAKIILGVPFYGRVWGQVPAAQQGLFQPGRPVPSGNPAYSEIKPLLASGFTRYWDPTAQAPYLYSPARQQFVSYEDPESAAAKARYVLAHGLAGIMFWSYFNDDHGELTGAIYAGLHPASPHRQH